MLGLRDPADIRTVLWVAKYYVFSFLAWNYDDFLISSPPLLLLSVLVLMYYSFAGACITHNAMHCKTFNSRWANDVWQVALSLTYGHPVSSFVPGHNLSHHRFTQTPKDPMRTTKLRYKRNLWNGVMFQPNVAWDVFKFDLKYCNMHRLLGDRFYKNVFAEFLFVGGTAIAMLILNPRKFLLYVWLPHFFGQWGIVTMNMLQHDGCDVVPHEGREEKVESWNHSRNFVGPVINYLTFNNGYHTIHHLRPTMHWTLLPAEHERVVKPKMHPALDQRCMARYIWKAFFFPGIRLRYDGTEVKLPDEPEPQDEDWVLDHIPKGADPKDFQIDMTWGGFLKVLPLLPAKLLCPLYSPVLKVD